MVAEAVLGVLCVLCVLCGELPLPLAASNQQPATSNPIAATAYSRSAAIGSTRVARSAGISVANTPATPTSTTITT